MNLIDQLRGEATEHLNDFKGIGSQLLQQLHRLDDIVEAVQQGSYRDTYRWINGNVTLGAADTDGVVTINPPFPGSAWKARVITTTGGVTGTVGGPCAVYFDAVDPGNLAWFIDNAQIHSDLVDIYIPENRSLAFHFYGQPNSQICTVGIQVQQYSARPHLSQKVQPGVGFMG